MISVTNGHCQGEYLIKKFLDSREGYTVHLDSKKTSLLNGLETTFKSTLR